MGTATDQVRLGHSPELDGLRGVAIAMVLVYHYVVALTTATPNSPNWWVVRVMAPTWSGVDLFFVLSGYLIGGILEDNRISVNLFHVFYWRRACRILPAYLINLTAAVLIPLAFADFFRETAMEARSFPVWTYFFFVQNLWMAMQGAWSSWPATWSLAVEEQFYLLLPALFVVAKGRLVPWLILLGVAAPVARYLLPNPVAAYVLPFARADSLFAGVLLALLVRRNPFLAHRLGSSRMLLFVLLGCSASIALIEPRWRLEPMRTAGIFFFALTYSAILLRSQVQPQGFLARMLRPSWLGWLGRRSYFIYLAHPTALIAAHGLILWRFPRSDGVGGFATTLCALACTLLAAEVSWRLIESPAIQAGRRQEYKRA